MRIIVPCDFTSVVDHALQYAKLVAAHEPECEYILFHVLTNPKGASPQEAEQAVNRLGELCRAYHKQFGIEAKPVVRAGDLFDTIPLFAEEVRADFVVMGTHGVRGAERIFGSKAIRVVIGSNIPFLVVQQAPNPEHTFKNILMPLGIHKDEVGKFQWAVRFAHHHGSNFHVLAESYTDPILTSTVQGRLGLLKRTFNDAGISYEVKQNPSGVPFQKAIEQYCKEHSIDMILIMITQSVAGISPLFDSRDQSIMANSMTIPVLCVNPSML